MIIRYFIKVLSFIFGEFLVACQSVDIGQLVKTNFGNQLENSSAGNMAELGDVKRLSVQSL